MTRGEQAEARALAFLQDQGLTLVARNFRCPRGELDLVMQQDDVLVFVEVRLRSHRAFATGAESVDHKKQQRLRLAAATFLQNNPRLGHQPARFDVVWFEGPDATPEWLQDAFQ